MPRQDSPKKTQAAVIKKDLEKLEKKWQLQLASKGVANSSNCPQKWRQFVNLAKQKKLPAGMNAQYQTPRLDLFQAWFRSP